MNDTRVIIRYSAREYEVRPLHDGIMVRAQKSISVVDDEESARIWLGNHGLRRSRIKNLLAAALHFYGPYMSLDHPHRKIPQVTNTPRRHFPLSSH
jgi:hypothetical protein